MQIFQKRKSQKAENDVLELNRSHSS